MSLNAYLPDDLSALPSDHLATLLREYQRFHVLLGFSRTDQGQGAREELAEAMEAIRDELRTRGCDNVDTLTQVN